MKKSFFYGLLAGLFAGCMISLATTLIYGRIFGRSEVSLQPDNTGMGVEAARLLESDNFKAKYNNILAQINKSFLNEDDILFVEHCNSEIYFLDKNKKLYHINFHDILYESYQ